LHSHLTPSYRVEAVDTAGHWAAVYLPRAGIPLVRGWFRQDDYPANSLLYESMRAADYRRWLRRLGVRYVVLADAPTDYSARREAELVRSGRARLRQVLRTSQLSIYEVPRAVPIVTGPGRPHVESLTRESIRLQLPSRGRYRLAVRYSPYWSVSAGACLTEAEDEMIRLDATGAGPVTLRFQVSGERALAALAGTRSNDCSD
jgi:hypothetical protein